MDGAIRQVFEMLESGELTLEEIERNAEPFS